MHRPARVVVAGGILAVGLAIGVRWWSSWQPPVVPPLPADISALDADLRALIQRAADAAHERPDSPQAWRELGMVYQANGMIELAAACHARAVALHSGDGQAWHLLGMCRSMLGDTAGAAEAGRRAVAAVPHAAAAHWRLGYWLFDLGELVRAQESFRRALDVDAGDPAAIVGLARVHLQRRENHEAAALLEHLLDSAPHAVPNEAYVNRLLASAYRRLERDEQADAALARSMVGAGRPAWFDPLSAELGALAMDLQSQLQRAKAMVNQGNFAQGSQQFEALRQRHPQKVGIHLAYAEALSQRGQIDAAIEVMRSALAVQPESVAVHLNLGAAHLTKARLETSNRRDSHLHAAAQHANRALAADPGLAAPHALRGEVLEELGHRSQAIASYQQAMSLDPYGPRWTFLAGQALHASGEFAHAVHALEQAARLAPRNGEAWRLLASAYAQLDRREEARAATAQARRWLSDDPRAVYAAEAAAGRGPGPAVSTRPGGAESNR